MIKHHIDTGDHHLVRQKPYRVSPFKKGIITEHVKEMAKNNIIRPSCSPWSSPIVLVGKRSDDGAVNLPLKTQKMGTLLMFTKNTDYVLIIAT